MEKEGGEEKIYSSDYATSIIHVVKANEKNRICGKFQCTLNPTFVMDEYPLLLTESSFFSIVGGKIFSKLDLQDKIRWNKKYRFEWWYSFWKFGRSSLAKHYLEYFTYIIDKFVVHKTPDNSYGQSICGIGKLLGTYVCDNKVTFSMKADANIDPSSVILARFVI